MNDNDNEITINCGPFNPPRDFVREYAAKIASEELQRRVDELEATETLTAPVSIWDKSTGERIA